MELSAFSPFISSPQQVEEARLSSAAFRDFLQIAERSSGENPEKVNPARARYRIADAYAGTHDDLQWADTVNLPAGAMPISQLIELMHSLDRRQLIYSLWCVGDFNELKVWLQAVKALVRYSYDLDGSVRGYLLLSSAIVPMIETVEKREYVLANGDMASDAITRNLGLRAKVFMLDRARRNLRPPEDEGIMERLSRTLSRFGR